jgi:hypothetical protein
VLIFRELACCAVVAQTSGSANQAVSPSQLPGKGLAQQDFLYAGESHDRKIFIVREGKIAWSYDDPAGKGEISNAVMLSMGVPDSAGPATCRCAHRIN